MVMVLFSLLKVTIHVLAALMVSTILLSTLFLIKIFFPETAVTYSLKIMLRSVSSTTPLLLSAGVSVCTIGAVVSTIYDTFNNGLCPVVECSLVAI